MLALWSFVWGSAIYVSHLEVVYIKSSPELSKISGSVGWNVTTYGAPSTTRPSVELKWKLLSVSTYDLVSSHPPGLHPAFHRLLYRKGTRLYLRPLHTLLHAWVPSFYGETNGTSVCTQSIVARVSEIEQVWAHWKAITVAGGLLLYWRKAYCNQMQPTYIMIQL